MRAPLVSVISIALSNKEFDSLLSALSQQTFQDFEFIGEVGGTIPEAWNRAIQKAKGDILVFTETDATPVNEYWLAELVNSVPDEKTIVKGLEITGVPWDLSNLACHKSVLEGVKFDLNFRWAEDTELFCRLRAGGYKLIRIDRAPVIHLQKLGKKRNIRRAFRYGMYHARLLHRYSNPIRIGNAATQMRIITMAGLKLLGFLFGYIYYFRERWIFNRR
jgi:GT2 family glycosyltransferase